MIDRTAFLAILLTFTVFGVVSGQDRLSGERPQAKEAGGVATAGSPSLDVRKTAHVSGHNVCGVISLRNTGRETVNVSAVADSLEVHFPIGVDSGGLPAGSTGTWYKVADVPVALPGPITPRATVNIEYCFSLCLAADAPGANSMRNVVAVSVTGPSGAARIFTTRSTSFPPPVLDCQACCTPDGACTDAVAKSCSAAGGTMQGPGTDCATTECPEACCRPDDSCAYEGPNACRSASGEPQGPGTDCETTQCCEPLGEGCFSALDCCEATARCIEDTCCLELAETGCTERSHCCEESGAVALCEEGRCCAPNRAPDSCHDAEDCCDDNAQCLVGTCCIALGDSGCTNLVGNDCCPSPFGAVVCEEGRCCAPTGAEDSCNVDSDCCDPGATCNGGTCCVRLADAGCEDQSDCCENDFGFVACDAGRCCAPNRAPDSCHDAGDCCDTNATCSSGTCCIALGQIGCTDLVGSDCCDTFGTVVCEAGRCCAPTGAANSCFVDTDCCDPDATCNGGTCCVRFAESGCGDASDCCDEGGFVACESGRCCAPNRAPDSCSLDTDCCDPNATCSSGTCCIALGHNGCTDLVGNDCCATFGTVLCEGGRCCAPTGAADSCFIDSDCCDPNAGCDGGTCCIPQFQSCNQDSECCSGLVCNGGICEGLTGP